MKKILTLVFVLVLLQSCETDFDITSEWRDIPVIYALLDQSDSTKQYIKINKVFLGDGNALEMAQVVDSLYYPESMEVKFEAFNFETNSGGDPIVDNFGRPNLLGGAVHSYILDRVSGYEEGLEKEDGVFQDDPFYLYKFTGKINQDFAYKVSFTTPSGNSISAVSPIVANTRVVLPDEDNPFSLVFDSDNENWRVRWRKTDFATTFDISFRFNYYEAPINDWDNKTLKSQIWTPIRNFDTATNTLTGSNYEKQVSKENFFSFLAERIGNTNDKIRFVESMELIVEAATKDLSNYVEINAGSNGLNSDQISAEYSNVNGGIGLFTSRFSKTIKFTNFLGEDDFACDYALTSGLNFAKPNGFNDYILCP